MKPWNALAIRELTIAATLVFALRPAAAQQGESAASASWSGGKSVAPNRHHEERSVDDLTLLNFFTKGWDEDWVHRHRRTRDMALLRVTTNFLERELRLDYARTDPKNNPKLTATDFANALIAYSVNRRLMLEVIANYQWNEIPNAAPVHGGAGGLLARLQIIETDAHSFSFQMRASPPNRGIGQTQTSLQYAVAGWLDIEALVPFLDRLGLYYSFQFENLLGSHKWGARENDISYDLSLAKTWTHGNTPVLGDFTTFVEAFATTDLDGSSSGRTALSLTPGVRFWFLPAHSLTLGVDLPLSHAPSFSAVYRATYILNFDVWDVSARTQ